MPVLVVHLLHDVALVVVALHLHERLIEVGGAELVQYLLLWLVDLVHRVLVVVGEGAEVEALERVLVDVGGCGSLLAGIRLGQDALKARVIDSLLVEHLLIQNRAVLLLARLLPLRDLLLPLVRRRDHRGLLVIRGAPLAAFDRRVLV